MSAAPETSNGEKSEEEQETSGFDEELASELGQLQYYSHGDYVEVEIVSVDRSGDRTAIVTFDPPLGEAFMREMDVPVDPSKETEFTNLLREAGHNFDTAQKLVGERVPAQYTDDGWEIQYTQPEVPVRERLRPSLTRDSLERAAVGLATAGALIYWPIVGVFVLGSMIGEPVDSDEPDGETHGVWDTVVVYVMSVGMWGMAAVGARAVAGLLGIQFPVEVVIGL